MLIFAGCAQAAGKGEGLGWSEPRGGGDGEGLNPTSNPRREDGDDESDGEDGGAEDITVPPHFTAAVAEQCAEIMGYYDPNMHYPAIHLYGLSPLYPLYFS